MSDILCVVCQQHRPQWPQVCEGDRKRLREQLAELVEQYALLDAEPGKAEGPRISGTRTPPLPGRLDVLNLVADGALRVHVSLGEVQESDGTPRALNAKERAEWEAGQRAQASDQVGETPPLLFLEQWVIDWIDQRKKSEHRPPCTVTELAKWLDFRLDDACDGHPAIDAFAAELQEQINTLRRVNGQRSDWRHIGNCPEVEDDKVCGTRLYANPWVDVVQCRGCGTRWDREHWLWLGTVLRDWDTEDEGEGAA